MKSLQYVLIILFLYFIPLGIFLQYSIKRKVNSVLLVIISIIYLGVSIFLNLMNFLPFILVIINIRYLKLNEIDCMETGFIHNESINDYDTYYFDIKSFKFLQGVKYAFGSFILTTAISILFYSIFVLLKFDLKQQEIVTRMIEAPMKEFLYTVPIAVIFAPVVEEFIFRWFIFEKILKKRVGIYFAAILSSLIFALVHFNLRAFPVLIAIGVVNCYLIHKKGYWYAVFNHLNFNLITTVLLFLQK